MGAIFTLALKDFRVLFRDKFGMFWILVFPIGYSVFFGVVFGGGDDGGARGTLSIAVVDEDDSELSRGLIERIDASSAVRLERAAPELDSLELAPLELDSAAGSAEVAPAEGGDSPGAVVLYDLESASDLVRKGKKIAFLRIPAGWGDAPYAMFGSDPEAPPLEVGLDPSRKAEQGILQGILMEATFGGLTDRFSDKEAMKGDIAAAMSDIDETTDLGFGQKLVLTQFMKALSVFIEGVDLDTISDGAGGGGLEAPFELVEVSRERGKQPRSAYEITFPQAIVWGLMSVALGGAIGIVRERAKGTLLRLRIAPLSRGQLLAGKATGAYLTCLMTMSLLVVFATVVLGVRFDSPGLLVLAGLCTAACFTGLMMTISVMGKTEEAVAGSSWGLMMPFAMIGGGMIPLIAMPEWLVAVSDFSPFKWAIYAIEGAVWRGFTLADMLQPCGILLGIGAFFFILGVTIFKRIDP